MTTFDELKNKMKTAMLDAEAKVLKDKPAPTTYHEVPALFEGWNENAAKAIRGALWITKKYNLIPEDTPLRQLWYMFIKLVFQKLHPSKRVGNPTHSFYKSLSDIIRRTDYWYKDFNIYNKLSEDVFQKPNYWRARLFPNVLVTLEKESYFHTFQNFCDLLGISLYAAGGVPSLSKAEEVARQMHDDNNTDDLSLYTLSDYDPAGFNINDTFKKQFDEFLSRFDQNVKNIKVAPFPRQYAQKELEQASYVVKPNTINQERWNRPENIEERKQYGLVDKRFLNPDFYDLSKTSEIREVLLEGDLKKEKHTAWIKEWKKKVEDGAEPHILGLEVESMPLEPFPEQMPNNMNVSDAVGNARMRFLVFEKLIEDFDLRDSLEEFMKNFFLPYPNGTAWSIVKGKADFRRLDRLKEELDNKIDDLISIQERVLRDDQERVYEMITDYRDEIIDNLRTNDNLIEDFEQSLREAIALNHTQEELENDFRFPELPDNINEYELTDETKQAIEDRIEENSDFINNLLRQLDEQIDGYGEE